MGTRNGSRVHPTIGRWRPFNIAFNGVYGEPPLSKDTLQHRDASYVARAGKDVALQSSKAGVRLTAVLNKALGRQTADAPK